MNKKLLSGIVVVIVGYVVVAVILRESAPWVLNWITICITLAAWIYLVVMVRKNKVNLFDGQVEPKLAKRLYKMLKAFLLVAGISLAVGIVSVIGNSVIYRLFKIEEPTTFFFFILIPAIYVFIMATIGGLIIILIRQLKTK